MPDHVLLDFHAEATSEAVAMGWHVDGRVTACVGTHTHVPTADGRVLPGGTAFITDVGMTGPRGGVIGVKREQALERFRSMTNVRFETSDEDPVAQWRARRGGRRRTRYADRATAGRRELSCAPTSSRRQRPSARNNNPLRAATSKTQNGSPCSRSK